jgi:hypothetical protein
VHCDLDPDNQLPFECDAIVVPSHALADWYQQRGAVQVSVIPDPAEHTWPSATRPETNKAVLTLGWIGHANNWNSLQLTRDVLLDAEFSDFRLVTVSNHPASDVKWSVEVVSEQLRNFDIGILPIGDTEDVRYKSANRLVMMMAAGLPVVAGPLPAYIDLVSQHGGAVFFRDADELRGHLRVLRDFTVRQGLGQRAHAVATQSFAVPVIAQRWVETLQSIRPATAQSISSRASLLNAELECELRTLKWLRQLRRNAQAAKSAARLSCTAVSACLAGGTRQTLKTLFSR